MLSMCNVQWQNVATRADKAASTLSYKTSGITSDVFRFDASRSNLTGAEPCRRREAQASPVAPNNHANQHSPTTSLQLDTLALLTTNNQHLYFACTHRALLFLYAQHTLVLLLRQATAQHTTTSHGYRQRL